ncbi:anti-sigma factor antagonist [Cytobacillus spongiae]|uniref:anti-sigma factor antagonist n=1 Tax=Cytobacillus spongiae TaxID=2901381 RepID=UPI001F400D0E|nr:anti-sigma factor antagonist [Cytobacillus spongiae]UII56221.1 anti-sigma factor antagonist [Cytobacillus spongiae]
MNILTDVKELDACVKVSVRGEIDAYTAPQLRETLFPLAQKGDVHIIVDLSDVTYMDSTGLGVFVGAFKQVRASNGSFRMIGLSERLKRLFEITGLADIMDINSQIVGEE